MLKIYLFFLNNFMRFSKIHYFLFKLLNQKSSGSSNLNKNSHFKSLYLKMAVFYFRLISMYHLSFQKFGTKSTTLIVLSAIQGRPKLFSSKSGSRIGFLADFMFINSVIK